jgi:hypothetical protein
VFQGWFRGDLAPEDFSLCEQALAPDFSIITPAGGLIGREPILAAIKGHYAGEPSDFEIRTIPRACTRLRGLHVSTYEEHQRGARSTIRVSTALIDGSLLWHHVHETWLTTSEL